MRRITHDESGDTLVEVLVALMIIGLLASAFFMSISTTASASKAHRDYASTDAVLRDYAEAAKQAVRTTCTAGNAGLAFSPQYTAPTGINVSATGLTCPRVNDPVATNNFQQVNITASVLNLSPQTLSIIVRTK